MLDGFSSGVDSRNLYGAGQEGKSSVLKPVFPKRTIYTEGGSRLLAWCVFAMIVVGCGGTIAVIAMSAIQHSK